MSKRDHRKKKMAKEAHKVALKAKVVAQYTRVSDFDLAQNKFRSVKDNFFHDLRQIFFGNRRCSTYYYPNMDGGFRSIIEKRVQALGGEPARIEEVVHPLIGFAHETFGKLAMANDVRRAAINLVDISKRFSFFDPANEQATDQSKNILEGFYNLARYRFYWKRMPDVWKPDNPDGTPEELFYSLVSHLLLRYAMPKFFFKVWYTGNETHIGWFLNVTNGNNIRTQKELPIVVTKKIAHLFMQAPAKYGVNQAFRYGQVLSLGGDMRVVEGVLRTPLVNNFENDEFWQSVIRFFIANPLLEASHFRDVYDFIYDQKYRNRDAIVVAGVYQEIGPPQPHFSMHGREPNTLMALIDRWHEELAREVLVQPAHINAPANAPVYTYAPAPLSWVGCGIKPFEYRQNQEKYYIRELTTKEELFAEGKDMRHCVASYASRCGTGDIAIFSMTHANKKTAERLVTIELDLQSKTVSQARRCLNATPLPEERRIMGLWIKDNNLRKGLL